MSTMRQQRSERRMLSEEWIRSTMELAHNMVQAYSDMEHDSENDQLLNWNRAQRQMRVRLMAAAEQMDRLQAQIDVALGRYDMRSELFTNDADLILGMLDALRKP